MGELTVEQLIKIIIGILVVVAVVVGVAFFFKNSIIDFFKNFAGAETPKILLGILK